MENWPVKSNQYLKQMPTYYLTDGGLFHAMPGIDTIANFAQQSVAKLAPNGVLTQKALVPVG